MNVTFLINSLRAGGAERVCVTLANEMQARGSTITVVVLDLRDAVLRAKLNPQIEVVDLHTSHARRSIGSLARYLRSRRPQLVLSFNHQLAVMLTWLRAVGVADFALIARNISTLSEKAAFEKSFWHRHVVHAATRMFYRKVDAVIAQSEGMKRDLIARYGFNEGRIAVIPNPLPAGFMERRADGPIPWHQRPKELLYVGRLNAVKGLELLIDAAAACFATHPDLILRLVGEGDQQRALEARAREAGIAERVSFEGYRPEPLEYHARARLVLLTSHYEGFPNVLVEALSQGTPVVSVNCQSGPDEIVSPGVNGLLVEGRDPAVFGAAIARALATEWDVVRVRATAERFSTTRVVAAYTERIAAAGEAHRARVQR